MVAECFVAAAVCLKGKLVLESLFVLGAVFFQFVGKNALQDLSWGREQGGKSKVF